MIGLSYYGLIQIGWVQADAQLEVPSLSLLSTKMKLLIQGVASCTGTSTPACGILFISCWNWSFRCMGIDQQDVCLGGMLGSSWIW